MKLYFLVDSVGQKVISVFVADTDGECVRNNMLNVFRVFPREDIRLYHVADFEQHDYKSLALLSSLREIDIDTVYKFPEQVVENISKSRNEDLKKMAELSKDIDNENPHSIRSRDLTDLQSVD